MAYHHKVVVKVITTEFVYCLTVARGDGFSSGILARSRSTKILQRLTRRVVLSKQRRI